MLRNIVERCISREAESLPINYYAKPNVV